jgi:Bax protein
MAGALKLFAAVWVGALVLLAGPPDIGIAPSPEDSFVSDAARQTVCMDDARAPITVNLRVGIHRVEAHPVEASRVLVLYRTDGPDLNAVHTWSRQVPRLLLHQLPYNLDAVEPDRRKAIFIATILPLALRVNEHVAMDRSFVLAARNCLKAGAALSAAAKARLDQLDTRYRGDGRIEELLRRVDIVPLSLVLAQAAIESGWGTSEPAVRRNAVFGEYAMQEDTPRGALKPVKRYMLRKFATLEDAVESYVLNLNSHRAYGAFRAERAALRRADKPVQGEALAAGILAYSERGKDYVDQVRDLIRDNGLHGFDKAAFAEIRTDAHHELTAAVARAAP